MVQIIHLSIPPHFVLMRSFNMTNNPGGIRWQDGTPAVHNYMKLEEAIEIVMALASKTMTTDEEHVAFNVVHDFFVNNIFGDE